LPISGKKHSSCGDDVVKGPARDGDLQHTAIEARLRVVKMTEGQLGVGGADGDGRSSDRKVADGISIRHVGRMAGRVREIRDGAPSRPAVAGDRPAGGKAG